LRYRTCFIELRIALGGNVRSAPRNSSLHHGFCVDRRGLAGVAKRAAAGDGAAGAAGHEGKRPGGIAPDGGEATMTTQVRTIGWATWVVVLIIVLLTVLAGLVFLGE
jgi:hypothetical protein